jgi:hypothetical protein
MRWSWVLIMGSLLLFPRLLVADDWNVDSLVGEDWYGLYMNGHKTGYSVSTVAKEAGGGVSVAEDARFQVNMAGERQEMHIESKRIYRPDGALKSVFYRVKDPGGVSEFNATVTEKDLALATLVGDEWRETRLPKPKETLQDILHLRALAGGKAKAGDSAKYNYFEPMYSKEISGESKIDAVEDKVFDGVTMRVFKVVSELPDLGISTTSYVSADGRTLEDTIAKIVVMRLEPKEIAMDVKYENDVIVSNAALCNIAISDARERASLDLKLFGPLVDEHFLNDARQTFRREPDYVAFTGKKLALDTFPKTTLPVTNADVVEWIKPSMFVQSDNAKLMETAKEIAGGETDALAVSNKLCRWVYDNVRTTYSARLSNALEVLEHREGDCTEHSILYIGLARALGIPAREAAGLIYVDHPKPAFYFHQWATVWVGQWLDVDPTFNQPSADATHIRLAEGDLYTQTRLIPVIGQLRVEMAEAAVAAK